MASPSLVGDPSPQSFIVSFSFDPAATPNARGYIEVDPTAGQYFSGDPANPNGWTALGQSPKPNGQPFPKNSTFTFDLTSSNSSLQLAWTVAAVPVPQENYGNGNPSPFNGQVLRNPNNQLVTASASPDSNNAYHYTLDTERLINGGKSLFAIYFTIVSGSTGAGNTYSIDPEMEVSDT